MKVDVFPPKLNICPHPLTDAMGVDRAHSSRSLQPGAWVKLLQLKSPFSFDEALLLCQCGENKWLVWIPDCGEAAIDTSQFCPLD